MEDDLKIWLTGIIQIRRAKPLKTKELSAICGFGIFNIDGKFFDVRIKYSLNNAELYAHIDEIEEVISFKQKSWDESALTSLVSNIINSLKKGKRYRLSRNHIVQI